MKMFRCDSLIPFNIVFDCISNTFPWPFYCNHLWWVRVVLFGSRFFGTFGESYCGEKGLGMPGTTGTILLRKLRKPNGFAMMPSKTFTAVKVVTKIQFLFGPSAYIALLGLFMSTDTIFFSYFVRMSASVEHVLIFEFVAQSNGTTLTLSSLFNCLTGQYGNDTATSEFGEVRVETLASIPLCIFMCNNINVSLLHHNFRVQKRCSWMIFVMSLYLEMLCENSQGQPYQTLILWFGRSRYNAAFQSSIFEPPTEQIQSTFVPAGAKCWKVFLVMGSGH